LGAEIKNSRGKNTRKEKVETFQQTAKRHGGMTYKAQEGVDPELRTGPRRIKEASRFGGNYKRLGKSPILGKKQPKTLG